MAHPTPGTPRVTCFGLRRVALLSEPASWRRTSQGRAGVPPAAGHPPAVRQTDGSLRETGGAATPQLLLGGLDEEAAFVESDADSDADTILGHEWRRAHDLSFLCDQNAVCLCAERGCMSGRRVRLDLTLDAPSSPATRLSRPWHRRPRQGADAPPSVLLPPPPAGRRSAVTALAAVAKATWADGTLAGLADSGTTLADGTALLVGHISFVRRRRAGVCQWMAATRPSSPRWLASMLTCLRNSRPAFLRTVARPSSSRGGFCRRAPRTPPRSCLRLRFCHDYCGLNENTQLSAEPLPHVDLLARRFFTKLDLAMAYMQFRIREEDQYKTSFRVLGGQYEFRVGAFGLHCMLSMLMRFMFSIFGRCALSFDSTEQARSAAPTLGRFVQLYCADIFIFYKTRVEDLQVHVRMLL